MAAEKAGDMPPITAKQVSMRIRGAPKKTKPGADRWQVAQWRNLTQGSAEEQADVLNECKKAHMYPE